MPSKFPNARAHTYTHTHSRTHTYTHRKHASPALQAAAQQPLRQPQQQQQQQQQHRVKQWAAMSQAATLLHIQVAARAMLVNSMVVKGGLGVMGCVVVGLVKYLRALYTEGA